MLSHQVDRGVDLLSTREQTAVALRVLERYGIADSAAGHITVREPGTQTWWTNPWDHDWATIRASDLVRIDRGGNVLEGTTEPSRFLDVHHLLYDRRPELGCVIHNHPFYACLYASLERPLLLLDQQSCLFFEDHVVYDEYRGLAQGEANTVPAVTAMGAHRNALLKSHGVIVCNEDLIGAVFQAIYIERAAHLSWEYAAAHPERDAEPPIEADVARKTRDAIQTRVQPFFALNWRAWARATLRMTPDVLD